MRTYVKTCVLAGLVIAVGCKGKIGQPPYLEGDVDRQRPIAPPSCAEEGIKPSDIPIRRITDVQYRNTVTALFSGVVTPGVEFPATVDWDGYSTSPEANAVSLLGAEQIMNAAEDVAAQVVPVLPSILPCAADADEACARRFVLDFGRRVFRRPVRSDEEAALVGLFTLAVTDLPFADSIGVVLAAMLQMPQFLYLVEEGRSNVEVEPGVIALTGYEVANRLSYGLTNASPDPELLAAAEDGRLDRAEGVAQQATRLLAKPEAVSVLAGFHREWFDIIDFTPERKDRSVFPQYDDEMAASMNAEMDQFIAHVMQNLGGSFAAMMTSEQTVVNRQLASLYGLDPGISTGVDDWKLATLNVAQRPGILSRATVLASHAHASETSVVFRGKLIRKYLLCQNLPAPPPNAQTSVPEFPPGATAREKTEVFLASSTCGGCHRLMNPIGLGMENFDAIGQWRDQYADGQPIDASGEVVGSQEIGTFDGLRELSEALVKSPAVHECVARQWFSYSFGRTDNAFDKCSINDMRDRFEDSGLNINELLIATTQTDAFRYRRTVEMQDRLAQ